MATSSTTRSPTPPLGSSSGSGGGGSTQESTVGEQAGAAAQTAKDETSQVIRSATDHAKSVLGEAGGELRSQGEERAKQASSSLDAVAKELRRFADQPHESPMVGDVARTLAQSAQQWSRRLDERGADGLMRDVTDFGRRRPGMFLAVAAAAGFAAGRLLRSADTPALRQAASSGMSDQQQGMSGQGGSGQGMSGQGTMTSGVGGSSVPGSTMPGSTMPSGTIPGGSGGMADMPPVMPMDPSSGTSQDPYGGGTS